MRFSLANMEPKDKETKNMVNKGQEIEDLVEKICTKMFFSDFTIRSKKFKNASGQEKEAGDILVLFDDTLLVVQVKTKIDVKPFSEKTETDLSRINKKIDDAIGQFKTIKRAIANFRFNEVETAKGYKIPFDRKKLKKVIGIVVFDLIGEEQITSDERTAIINGFEIRYEIPIHIFKRSDFEIISSELDTMPDFINYIETRYLLYSKRMFIEPPFELNLLALYKTKPEDVHHAIEENALVIVNDEYWEWYQNECKELIQRRNLNNRPSYLIDDAISWLHSGVGFDPSEFGITYPFPNDKEKEQGTVPNYLAVATELAKTSRLTRRKLGEKLLECLERATGNGLAYSVIIEKKNNSGIILLSSSKSRMVRSKILYRVAAMAYCLYNLEKIVGFATEPLNIALRSYDAIFLSGVEFDNRAEILEDAKTAFGTTSEAKFYEFFNSPASTQ